MDCVYQCPGLAIFGYSLKKDWLFLPVEYAVMENSEVFLVDNNGKKLGEGIIEKVLKKPNKTNIVRVRSLTLHGQALTTVRGFVVKENYPMKMDYKTSEPAKELEKYVCHCDDVTLTEILNVIGDRKFISVDEIKHTTRLGMGACRGKRCIRRLKQLLRGMDISVVGEATPRGPLSNQINFGDLYPKSVAHKVHVTNDGHSPKIIKVDSIVAGGGIGGSALFRYLAEAGKKPLMINFGRGASWRNIAGGRPAFSLPEIADIAEHNLAIFKELQQIKNIDYHQTRYVTFAHDEAMYKTCEDSMSWSDAYMIESKDFVKKISPFINPKLNKYMGALITNNCWQATPGRVIDLVRRIGINHGGTILEDCQLINLTKENNTYIILVRDHEKNYVEYHTQTFINALGPEGHKFAKMIGIDTGLYPVKHQAFITRRLPMLGLNNQPLDMLIDRRKYNGFVAVYGQQLAETGQIIGCASPAYDPQEADKNLKVNSKEFLEIATEIFTDWIPQLSSVGFQAIWAGYYIEPRMIIDTELGLFLGLRGQGFMLGQYLAKLYVDNLVGKETPAYFERLKLIGDGLPEKAFK